MDMFYLCCLLGGRFGTFIYCGLLTCGTTGGCHLYANQYLGYRSQADPQGQVVRR